jgi:hypothetical protein
MNNIYFDENKNDRSATLKYLNNYIRVINYIIAGFT